MGLRSRTVDVVFGALEMLASLHSFVTRMRRRLRRETDPIPLVRYSSGNEFRSVDSGRYRSTLADAKPAPITERLPRPPRVPRI